LTTWRTGNGGAVSDSDAMEAGEWLEAFDDLLCLRGAQHCEELIESLLDHAGCRGVNPRMSLNTPYRNMISPENQPVYPGNLEIESRITAMVRWNALARVVRVNRASPELGGHLASYASAADLFEVGFQHFFHGDAGDKNSEPTADLVFFQPHSAPSVYARAFLEGRLSETNLANYRREVGGRGLSSYPRPRLTPGFWQFPTGSMGARCSHCCLPGTFHALFAESKVAQSVRSKGMGLRGGRRNG
jgi:pyruvate dehydrogenase E1 component